MAWCPPHRRLKSVDFPTLGRPTMATSGFIVRGSFVAQFLELAGVARPALVDADEQLEVRRPPDELADLVARARADLADHAPALPDDDLLLRLFLHVHRRRDHDVALVALLPLVDGDGDGVRH